MKRGTGKYKGMIPLKCFNCDGVGYFYNKFPYKNKESNEERDSKKKNKIQNGRSVTTRFASPYAILHRGPYSISLCRLIFPIDKIQRQK
jgi:hypothetical protein